MAKILVVDDEESIRDLVKLVLEREGHSVEGAGGGSEALERLRRARFDLVILDRAMPLMSGIEVLGEVRRDPALRGLKVLMCTAAGLMSDVDEALSAGADDYAVKPLDMRELVRKVARRLDGAGTAPEPGGLLGRLRRLLP